ncbi:MAG: hypothetical protein ACRD8O_12405 [Bryobacteraceae bacterium]
MAFLVEIEPQALNGLDAIAEYIKNASSFETAERWFNAMMQAQEVRLLLNGRRRLTPLPASYA